MRTEGKICWVRYDMSFVFFYAVKIKIIQKNIQLGKKISAGPNMSKKVCISRMWT